MIQTTPNFALFAVVILAWHAANYLPEYPVKKGRLAAPQSERPRLKWRWEVWALLRGCAAGAVVCGLAGWSDGWALGLLTSVACLILPLARCYLVAERRLADFEILANVIFAALVWKMIAWHGVGIHGSLASLLEEFPRLGGYAISAGLLIFVVRGGTYIVRGILACGGTMPPDPGSSGGQDGNPQAPTARVQLNHGRLIGDVERVILALLVANGQFASLAFFFAAKGLIRSKDLEVRAWADYLLLGSLSSFLTALVIGMLIAKAMR